MAKKKHPEPVTDKSLLKPADLKYLQSFEKDGECFGKEYEARHEACSDCASAKFCFILYAEKIQEREKDLKKKQGPYLDEVQLNSVDWDELAKVIIKFSKKGDPITVQEVFNKVKAKFNTKDDDLVILALKWFKEQHTEITTKDQKFVHNG